MPVCAECNKPIKGNYAKIDAVSLHDDCVEPYIARTVGTCAHCKVALQGAYVTLSGGNFSDKVSVHEGCLEAFKAANEGSSSPRPEASAPLPASTAAQKPQCAHCRQMIMGAYVSVSMPGSNEEVDLHDECADPYMEAVNATEQTMCGHCSKRITGEYVKVGGVALHEQCADEHVAASLGRCTQCQEPLSGKYISYTGGVDGDVKLHDACISFYRTATRPACICCGRQVLDDKVFNVGGCKYHEGCLPPDIVDSVLRA